MKKTIISLIASLSFLSASHALSFIGTSSGNDNNEAEIEGIISTFYGSSVDISLLGKSDDGTNPSGFEVFNVLTPGVIGDLQFLHGDGAKGETFDISYVGAANVSFLTIKWGSNYDVFAYMDDIFTVNYQNAISHISVWTTPEEPPPAVPDSGATFALLGAGMLGLIGINRLRRK